MLVWGALNEEGVLEGEKGGQLWLFVVLRRGRGIDRC